jgi:4-oxalocrotonate tautomerase
MAIIDITLVDSSTQQQREMLMKSVTEAAVKSLGTRPEVVRTIIREVPKTHFAVAGVPKSQK